MISTIFISILMILIAGPLLYLAFVYLKIKEYSCMCYFLVPALIVCAIGFKLIGV